MSAEPLREGEVRLRELLEEEFRNALAYARRHAHAVVLQQESCSDIVQSVCRDMWVRRDEFEWRGIPAFRKLLFQRVLWKLVDKRDYYTRARRDVRRRSPAAAGFDEPEPLDLLRASVTSPSAAAAFEEALDRFQRCYQELSEDHKLVILRIRLQGATLAEVAAETGRSVGAIKQLLRRALVKLGLSMARDRRGTDGPGAA